MKLHVTILSMIILAIANCQRLTIDWASCNFNDASVCYYSLNDRYRDLNNPPWSMVRSPAGQDGAVAGQNDLHLMTTGDINLKSPEDYGFSGNYCLSLDYYLNRGHIHILTNAAGNNVHTLFAREQTIQFKDKWQHYKRTLDFRAATYWINILASTGVGLNNLLLLTGECEETNRRYCDFDTVVGGSRRLSGDTNYVGCDWVTLTSASNPWTVILDSQKDHSTKSTYGGVLKVGRQYVQYAEPQLTFTMSPEEGVHCFEFWTNGEQKWTISEEAINTNITNVLFSQNENYETRWQRQIVTIDPVVALRIILKISTLYEFKIDSVQLRKGKCRPRAYCNFKRDLCGYTTTSSYNVGAGNLVHSESQPIPNNRSFYMDFSVLQNRPQVAELKSENIYESGNMCYQVRYRSGKYAVVEIFSHVNGQNQRLESQLVGDGIEKSIYADIYFKVPTNFKIVIQMKGHGNTKMVPILKVAFHKGTCQNFLNPNPRQPIRLDYLCQQSGHYIPRYRTCDGVIDCPMGEDEGEHCQDTNCSHGGIPCTKRGHRFCLVDTAQFCDGESDCDDGIDEDSRMCDEQSFCDNFCLNGGQCMFTSFSCNCTSGLGKRCN